MDPSLLIMGLLASRIFTVWVGIVVGKVEQETMLLGWWDQWLMDVFLLDRL